MTKKTETPAVDDFDAAFAEAVKGLDADEAPAKPDETPEGKEAAAATAEDTAADKVAADAAAKADADKATADAAAKATADAAAQAEADKAAADAAKTPEQKAAADTAEAERGATEKAAADTKAAEDAAQRRADEAARRVAKENEDKAAQAAADKKAEEERKVPVPTLGDDDDKLIKKFAEDWPEQAAVMNKLVTHQVSVLEARVAQVLLDTVGKVYKDFEPFVQTTGKLEASGFRAAVVEAHSDYDGVVDKLEPWIKTQPAYLQESMMRVYNGGTAQELIDLVGRYKKESGVKTEVPAALPSAPDTKQAARAAAANKAAALAPVTSKRTAPNPSGPDPMNYDDAFAEAAVMYSPTTK